MTRSQKNKLFGRLSTEAQQYAVAQAHWLAAKDDAPVGIYMREIKPGLWSAFVATYMPSDEEAMGEAWHLIRTVKPRVRNDIAEVYRSESRKRSAPWEGRGRRD